MSASKPHRIVHKLLIANRGEIAARIIRACREMGVQSVAVFSEADRRAPYLANADRVVCIGPAPAAESYLCVDRIIQAALDTRADAIHPGYGFLSENAGFAARCAEHGLIFIGPAADVIAALGDKAAAKALARQANVPVVPGYYGDDQTNARLIAEAGFLGTPLLIKATAGGGGRGMRVVEDLAEFPGLLREARREALAAFGSENVLLERYLARPRHIEVQIMGDSEGRVFALHERECSLQRRHQKILEESPSPGLDADLRSEICEAAVRIGQAAGYRNAGTVEFLLEGSGTSAQFYFLEVNTRLQVEHPVTEARTALDLVRLQIDIASGRPTPGLIAPMPAHGHAIEVRIYSEDPARGFAPSLGTLAVWSPPTGPGVRVDSGVEQGDAVTPYYDPMLAKLIVHATTRPDAIDRMIAALEEFHVIGVETNIPYLLAILADPAFRAGETHVRFLDERFAAWRPANDVPDEALLALAAQTLGRRGENSFAQAGSSPHSATRPGSAWNETGNWRNV